MIIRITSIILFIFVLFSPSAYSSGVNPETQSKREKFKQKIENLSAKHQKKLKRKVRKLKNKIVKKNERPNDTRDAVRLGLAVLLVGAILSILGFAGIAELLVTIGLVVFGIGLALWLVGLIL